MDATPTHTQPFYSAYTLPSAAGGDARGIAGQGLSARGEAERALKWIMGPFADAEKAPLH